MINPEHQFIKDSKQHMVNEETEFLLKQNATCFLRHLFLLAFLVFSKPPGNLDKMFCLNLEILDVINDYQQTYPLRYYQGV